MTGSQALQATAALALARFNERRFAEAEALYRRILAESPHDAGALNMLGLVLAEAGNGLQAVKYIDQALRVDPLRAAFHTNRGEVLRRWGLVDEGLEACERAAELDPACAEVRNNLGLALLGKGRHAEALVHIRAAIGLRANMPQAHFNLGRALKGVGEWSAARAAFETAVAHAPNYAEAWFELATVQERLDDPHASVSSCERALAVRGDMAEAWVAHGDALTSLGDVDRAIESYRAALKLSPSFAIARYQLSLALLGRGAYTEGWQLYESRSHPTIPGAVTAPMMPMPAWQGEPMRGQRLLILTEQGYGDHIQFCRFVPGLAQSGVEIVVGASSETERLTATLPGVSRVVTHVDEAWASGAQRWTFIGSLPYLLAVGARDVQMTAPYLHADADRVDRWRRRLASLGKGLNVGLVWAGRYSHGNDWRRSIPLQQLAALSALDGINFVSLQVGDRAIAADHVAPIRMLNVGSELADFAETAALICALDLLISADTAPAHLAGALGRPVWTLLPFMPDWRWRADHDVSSWYPSMRLFRQQRRGDWGEVMNRVARELAAHASTRSLIG